MNDNQDKLDRYKSFLEADPKNLNLIRDTAELYSSVGDSESAQALVDQGLGLSPNNPELRFLSASLAIQSHQFQDSEAILQNLLNEGVDNPGIRYNLGLSSLYAGNYESVDSALTPLITSAPETAPHASVILARAKHHLGDIDSAIQLTQTFLENDAENVEANGLMALLQLDGGDSETAATFADKALATDPDNHESLITKASISLEAFELDRANDEFELVLSKNKKSGRAWMGVGMAAMSKNDVVAGEEALKNAVELMPSHLGSWNALGWAQLVQNKLVEAEETFLKALEIDRNFADSHGSLACLKLFQGKAEEAKPILKRAERLNSNSFSAQFANVLLMQNQGSAEEAQKELLNIFNRPVVEDGKTLIESINELSKTRTNYNNKDK